MPLKLQIPRDILFGYVRFQAISLVCLYCSPVSIAIIGGGIGGTSYAYFLKEYVANNITLDIYEQDTVGGRLATFTYDNNVFETGGSVILRENKYMNELTETFGLQKRKNLGENQYLGIYDGEKFLFTESKNVLVNIVKAVWRYGFSILRLSWFIDKMVSSFDRLYEMQKEGIHFDNVRDLLSAANPNFPNFLNIDTMGGMMKYGSIRKKIIEEVVKASIRCNYGQTDSIPLFVGSVSSVGMIGNLWKVEGGNKKVAEHCLRHSEAQLYLFPVTSIKRQEENKFSLTFYKNGEHVVKSGYDVVVLATPISTDARYPIVFQNFPRVIKSSGNYHRTVATFVKGNLNYKYFDLKNSSGIDVIVNNDENSFFNSIGLASSVNSSSELKFNVWKVFSKQPLSNSELTLLFEDMYEVIHIADWLAYPHYDSFQRNDTFVLYDGLYYINAIEWAASAMEMSVISAKNVALLTANYLKLPKKDTRQHDEL